MEPKPISLEFNPEQMAAQRQDNYEETLLKQLIEACVGNKAWAYVKNLKANSNNHFTLEWFVRRYAACPVALAARRVDDPFTFGQLTTVKKFKSSEVWRTYRDTKQNFPDREHLAMVFDYHGDNVPSLVLHNAPFIDVLSVCRVSLKLDEEKFFIDLWKDFATALALRFNPFT